MLVVRAEGRLLVLDNGTDRIVDTRWRDYRPIVTFSGNRAWTHGYRREAPPMVLPPPSSPHSPRWSCGVGLAVVAPALAN